MSKLNKPNRASVTVEATAKRANLDVAYSANGNKQFAKPALQMLYELTVSTMFGKGNQLNSADALVKRLKDQLRQVVDAGEYDFIANLAIHARTHMNVRTIPIVLVVEFAKALSDKRQEFVAQLKTAEAKLDASRKLGKATAKHVTSVTELREQVDALTFTHMRQLVCDVIQRADQITDLYAYALQVFGGKNKVPMAIKRGVADAFNKFSEYAFAKYNRAGAVKLRDVLRIVHPTAIDVKQGQLFEKIMKDTLETPYTWETELSANGQKPVGERLTDKQLWTELVTSGIEGWVEVA